MNPLPEETVHLLALQLTPGAGHVTVGTALAVARRHGADIGTLLGQSAQALVSLLPPGCDDLAAKLAACTPALRNRAKVILDSARAKGIEAIIAGEREYPESLVNALDRAAPPVLYTAGNRALLREAAAGVVGTRRPTEPGRILAGACARLFTEAGITVVSGGAQGIDTAAQETALSAGGSIIVVLPMGLLHYEPSPACRAALAESRAVLVSEFPPDAEWQTHAAVTRNATISAFSRLLCLIEPGKPGGSLLTARHTVSQGKTVFYSRPNEAGDWLRQHPGAAPLTSEQGVLRQDALMRAWEKAKSHGARQAELW